MEEEDLNYPVPEVGVEFVVVLLLRQVGARETGERETSCRCRCKKDWQLAGGKGFQITTAQLHNCTSTRLLPVQLSMSLCEGFSWFVAGAFLDGLSCIIAWPSIAASDFSLP